MPGSRPGESAAKDLHPSPSSSCPNPVRTDSRIASYGYRLPRQSRMPFAHHSHYNSPVLSPGVSKIIGRGSECFIGLIDEPKVLKHPRIAGDNTGIEVEAQLLAVLGSYPRIVNSYGLSEHGLLLQYAPNGNLSEYIRSAPRFQNGYFPTDDHACSKITTKCRRQLYESAEDVIFDISELQTSKGVGEEHENN